MSDRPDEYDYLRATAEEYVFRTSRRLGLSRRHFLELTLGGALSAFLLACEGDDSPAPTTAPASPATGGALLPVKDVPEALFRDLRPNFEMRWQGLQDEGYHVPNSKFFVRNHTGTPRIDADAWRLRVGGSGVERALELTLDDLHRMESRTVSRYVECAGNGRSFFETIGGQRASGTQWLLGGIGVAEWRGVPMNVVLQEAGLKPTARDLMPAGLDERQVRRQMPLAKALEDDTLLVYEMNGEPLPPDHGAPVRVLVPGWAGIASIKWVGSLEVSEEPLFSQWNTELYVFIGPTYTADPPSLGPRVSTQNIKSALELDWPAALTPGQQTVRGRAWSPAAAISRVEYSIDGSPYLAARLGDRNEARSWVLFDFDWDATAGEHTIRTLATDAAGNTQPDTVPFNEQGYLYNGVVPHPLRVT
jgi:DMSO/TMAO reductase YedYZ molybdopterin-dependent catalytic subunit